MAAKDSGSEDRTINLRRFGNEWGAGSTVAQFLQGPFFRTFVLPGDSDK
jgi:hypothetical protein